MSITYSKYPLEARDEFALVVINQRCTKALLAEDQEKKKTFQRVSPHHNGSCVLLERETQLLAAIYVGQRSIVLII